VDLELLSAHAEGGSRTLLGQLASLLIFCSLLLAAYAGLWASGIRNAAPLVHLAGAWSMEHFLIATTMLVVGLLAVLSWESTFPDRRDVFVLGPLPVGGRILFGAKVCAAATALGLTLAALHVLAGLAWPLALAQYDSAPAPALVYDPPLPALHAAEFPAVMNRDIAPLLRRFDLVAANGGAGIVIGISERGVRRVMTYGAAKADSLFEIGSITKTMTGLLLAQMAVQGKLELRDRVRDLLPAGMAPRPAAAEITLLDLATHHSGLPRMPDNPGAGDEREKYTNYGSADLADFLRRHGLSKPADAEFHYSNLGYTVLGEALACRGGGDSYAELLRREITGPLGMRDTVITLAPNQARRFLQGFGYRARPTAAWELKAMASAGGIRSSAGDVLTYLEAQLHPEKTPLRAALLESQRLRARVTGRVRIALAWVYNPDTGVYAHDGANGGIHQPCMLRPAPRFCRRRIGEWQPGRLSDCRFSGRACPATPGG
jgi:CubicO group peptidase (beta-lactamase class C family)